MFRKQTKIYTKRKKSAVLIPTLIILLVSAVAALAGTIYWDKLQKQELLDQQVQSTMDDQVPKETPTEPEPDNTLGSSENDSAELPKLEKENVNALPNSLKDDEITMDASTDETKSVTPITVNITSDSLVKESPLVEDTFFDDAAFVGDSITEGIGIYGVMDNAKVIATKGINLDSVFKDDQIRTADGYKSVLSVLKETNPKKIYVMFGANGVGWFTKEHFAKTYTNFIANVKEQHPDSTIYLQSILPVTKDYDKADNNITNQKIVEYNELVVKIAEEQSVNYLDVASVFRDKEGALPDDSSGDGMHFSKSYYDKWFDYLRVHTLP